MDSASTSFVLGYHGCDRDIAERILSGKQYLGQSHNDYDWLGDGIYFWEHNARRAFEFALELRDRKTRSRNIKRPAVVGAIVDLGVCLNLLDSRFIEMVRNAHRNLEKLAIASGAEMPQNTKGDDLLLRPLDCAVIRHLHNTREDEEEEPFDTVRAAFVEGERLYPNAGFAAKNHIQICVRNHASIKGYFRPLGEDGRPMKFQ
ncbi:MAG TPA: hypothetical protein VL992_03825 [Tepidisphaeraceae bacterium]|nr:hypothetical protein [Tepidisphaeraceae bacterium]